MSETPLILRKIAAPLSYGVEIEGRSSLLRDNYLMQHLGFFFVTTDGSLEHYDSIELVSQPMPIKMLLRVLNSFKKKYGEIDPEWTAGIHIHVSRTPKAIKRLRELALFLSRNQRNIQIECFFGRPENLYARFEPPPTEDHLDIQTQSRHVAVNFRPRNTIEVRAFGNRHMFFKGIESTLAYVRRLDALINSNEIITADFLRKLSERFRIL